MDGWKLGELYYSQKGFNLRKHSNKKKHYQIKINLTKHALHTQHNPRNALQISQMITDME